MGDIGDRDEGHVNNVFNILKPSALKNKAYVYLCLCLCRCIYVFVIGTSPIIFLTVIFCISSKNKLIYEYINKPRVNE